MGFVLNKCSNLDDDVTLLAKHEGETIILCHLNKRTKKDRDLNLYYEAGNSISLFSRGQGIIHVSG